MATIKRKIILSGELGKRFGRTHFLAISTPAEAIRALCANFKDFASYMSKSEDNGVAYRVTVDKERMEKVEDVHNPFSETFRITPVIAGAKGGFGGILLGAALIAVSFVPGLNVAVWAGASATWASVAFGLGTSLLLGGISTMLSPQPKAAKPAEAAQNAPSYAFNGPVNTTLQGQCVPVGYGRLIVGSAVISAGLVADEYSNTAMA